MSDAAGPIRIPFDSLTLSAVQWELRRFVGAKVQAIHQPDEWTIGIGLYSKDAGVGMLLLSCHPEFSRAYLATKRMANRAQPPVFCATLRSRLEGGFLASVDQIEFDRILDLRFEHPGGAHVLVGEFMGKHSNLVLVDGSAKIIAAAKWVSREKSVRPILPGGKYHRPPFQRRPPVYEARPGDDLPAFTGASPFLRRLVAASPSTLQEARRVAVEGKSHPVLSPGHGAYPMSVAALGLKEFTRASISVALEQHYDSWIPSREADAMRHGLEVQIRRVMLAREVALQDLSQAKELGDRAGEIQRTAELVLAYGASLPAGASELSAFDYEGKPVKIALDPDLDFKGNAAALFDKAKKAKIRSGFVADQIERLSGDRADLASFLERLQDADLAQLTELREQARKQRWLHANPEPTKRKEDRPYEGHRIRVLLAPGGWTVLYGDNAEANDYLILRIAKPNDWWLHVRGNTSSHVVIVTRNQPEKVGRETIEFAARVAVKHSVLKHSGYVPVDYTLRKHVRKPRGAPKGTALYTHEKTLHVESRAWRLRELS